MDNKYRKVVVLFLLFTLNSCGWLEKEEIKEINIKYGYRVLYDTNNLAFNFFSISSDNGSPLLDDCIEFYFDSKYLYIKQSINNSEDFKYYIVNNSSKEIIEIEKNQYEINCKNCKPTNFHNIIEKKK
jgi:hypothetical protein